MSKRSKFVRPSTPEEIAKRRAEERERQMIAAGKAREAERVARKNPDKWGVNTDALAGQENVGEAPPNISAAVVEDTRGRKFRAYRSDVFDLLLSREGITAAQHEAARRLETDIAARAGLTGAAGNLHVVDCGSSPAWSRAAVTSHMLMVGRRVDAVLAGCGASSRKLLTALIEPMVESGRIIAWRGIVQRETKEDRPEIQAAMIRRACEDLVEAYKHYDAQPERKETA